jgi:RNase adapter protein RapZ
MFLEADEQTLVDRYKETRRRHPLSPDGQVVDGIRAERAMLAPLRERADVVMDTTDSSGGALRRRIAEEMLDSADDQRMAITLQTFGFKNGPPREADLTLDVRFLPNPHYDPDLRPLTGHDAPVREAVLASEDCREFLRRTGDLLSFLIPRYAAEGKTYFTLGVGCTGGRHRSVAITEELARRLRQEDSGIDLFVRHRDVEK